MRTDALLDKRKVFCPNTSTLGYDKRYAQVGDIVLFTENEQTRIGRMIARVKWAPDSPPIKNYILAIVLNEDMTHTSERWIQPERVTRVQALRDHREVIEYFLSDQLIKEPLEDVRRILGEWPSMNRYRAWRNKALQLDTK